MSACIFLELPFSRPLPKKNPLQLSLKKIFFFHRKQMGKKILEALKGFIFTLKHIKLDKFYFQTWLSRLQLMKIV